MSLSQIFTAGTRTINDAYLPAGLVTNPLTGNLDADGNDVFNVGILGVGEIAASGESNTITLNCDELDAPGVEIVLGTKGGIACDDTASQLQLIATGANVVVTNKTNTGQVYDAYFNPVGNVAGTGDFGSFIDAGVGSESVNLDLAGQYRLEATVQFGTSAVIPATVNAMLEFRISTTTIPLQSVVAIDFTYLTALNASTVDVSNFVSGTFTAPAGAATIQTNNTAGSALELGTGGNFTVRVIRCG
jgi:hypothetical protein